MPPRFSHELRDPIHGLIRLSDREVKIIDSEPFQRLRRIRQLARADLVYPGALHTRFEHSLGTLHVSERILRRLAEFEQPFYTDEWEAIRLAALLHDVGHGPFSHVSEYVLDKLYAKEMVGAASSREKIHEKITVDFITKLPELADLIPDAQRELIVKLLEGDKGRDFRRDIVSSSLDADKMDYLLRDEYYAGVKYGHFDLDKIIDSCRVLPDGDETILAISEDGIFAVEQLIISKHHMTQQVYGHRVRSVTDAMIVRGLELAVSMDSALHAAYRYDGQEDQRRRYLDLDDSELSARIIGGNNDIARDIFLRLRNRRLYKDLAQIRLDGVHVAHAPARAKLLKLRNEDAKRASIEESLAELLGRQPSEIIVHPQSVKNPAYSAPGVIDPEAIFVVSRGIPPRSLDEFPEVVAGKQGVAETLHVIAPWDEGESLSAEERRTVRQQLNEKITAHIMSLVGGSA